MVKQGIRLPEAEEARIASNQEEILAALMDAADPNTPPTEDEILGLILGEVAFMHKAGVFAHPRRLGVCRDQPVMQSILVMQLFRHGAVLQSTPALSALRTSFPGARIHALVCKPFGDSLRGNPDVDEIIEWDVAGALAPLDSLDMESADAEATVGPLSDLKDSLRPFQERRFDAVYNLSNNALSALVAYLLRPRHAAGMVFCRDRSYRVRNDWLRHLFAGSNVRSLNVFNRVDVLIHACGGDSSARRPLARRGDGGGRAVCRRGARRPPGPRADRHPARRA